MKKFKYKIIDYYSNNLLTEMNKMGDKEWEVVNVHKSTFPPFLYTVIYKKKYSIEKNVRYGN